MIEASESLEIKSAQLDTKKTQLEMQEEEKESVQIEADLSINQLSDEKLRPQVQAQYVAKDAHQGDDDGVVNFEPPYKKDAEEDKDDGDFDDKLAAFS
jgi:hypothetical protein